jgi:2-polyprenyl-6-hydroxyphenyl methylase/3-demethylubiquinone-9 3-methyltransferase
VIGNDLTIYSEYADEWWIPGAPRFRSLQNLTPFRLSLIREHIGEVKSLRILDVGCGGGLVAIPLLNEGAEVVGCDISRESIAAATRAADGRGEFLTCDARKMPFSDESFDHVLLMDLVDHIPDYSRALTEAARIVKPGGKVFVGTINRTFSSRLFAIILGEGLRLIPKGTHSYTLFIKPDELIEAASRVGLSVFSRQGERIQFLATLTKWAISMRRGRSESVAYSVVFIK